MGELKLGVVAIGGPLLGGLATSIAGWRMALAIMAVYGALALAVVVWRLPETLLAKNPRATALRPMLATWWQVLRHPFLAKVRCICVANASRLRHIDKRNF